MAKKITIKDLQNQVKITKGIANDLAKDNLELLKSRAQLKDKIEILTRQNDFEEEVKKDYILSNKHIRDMEKKRTEMEYEKSKLKNGIINAVLDVSTQVLPSLLIDLLTQNKNKDGK